ncbi:sialic acid-binding Ig-like lectin 14 [Mugil cephalus]|uniref:sialic acid-binding Ig-like lectin 14 n=1 Tax=Mugil cephalus TaxID=48193 RepID=UPI001FB58ED3|nr:sialic acid-binding Ig-like lectin 14 [Mugil cephalus]
MSVMAALCVNVVTVNMLLSVFFLSGVWTECGEKTGLNITAPKKMEALSGSCLKIPCNYTETPGKGFNSSRKIFGVWIKNDSHFGPNPNNVVFNSSGSVNIYPMNITGDLSQKNCTTLFSGLKISYSDTYYFRIDNEPFKATADCDPLQITVKDSPWRPTINISGDVKEKESVTITCSAFTPCPHSPPQLTWNLQQDPHNKIEENTDGTFTTKIQETITLSDTHDGNNIICSVRYPVNEGKDVKTAETQETLSVSYAPKDTSASISPSGLVSAGSWVNLTCSSRAKPPIKHFTWFKNSKDGPMIVSEGHFYSFNVTDGGVYYCVASNQLGNHTSPWIHLNVGVLLPWEPVVGGIIGIIVLICLVIFVWWLKSRHQSQQQTQSQRGGDLVVEEAAGETEEVENIHYGEINFSKQRRDPSSDSVQDSGQQQDRVYTQVKIKKPAKRLTQTVDDTDYLYAEVKKK